MTFDEFRAAIEERFKVRLSHYKSKAGHEMMDVTWPNGEKTCESISGPDAGYSLQFSDWTVTLHGWAYVLQDGQWTLERDGKSGWRQGTNPFPEIPERK